MGESSKRGKGQVTVFLIFGILLVFVVGFIIFVSGIITKQIASSATEDQIKERLSSSAVNAYVTSCLDAITEDGVVKLSMQGGVLNFSSGVVDSSYVRFNNTFYNNTIFNVSIAIVPNIVCSHVAQTAPDYPYEDAPIRNDTILQFEYSQAPYFCQSPSISNTYKNVLPYSGFFGLNNLSKLCYYDGQNRNSIRNTLTGRLSCLDFLDDSFINRSIQQQLQSYIASKIVDCLNFSVLVNKSSATQISGIANPLVNVTFGRFGFNVKIIYPIQIQIQNRQPVMHIMEFGIDKALPLKELYAYAFYMAKEETKDVNFDALSDRSTEMINTYYGYDVRKYYNVNANYTDVIMVIDNRTRIRNNSLIFEFAIKNRRPALETIHYVANRSYDINALVGEEIMISPMGYDPDNEKVTYEYSGWKEDYEDKFNWIDNLCVSGNIDYLMAHCTSKAMPITSSHAWTSSLAYQDSRQNASIKISPDDLGFHNVTIHIYDRGRLDDYQIVRILVLDKPSVHIDRDNFYSDLDTNRASIEDPYLLDARRSTTGFGGFGDDAWSNFTWNDSFRQIKVTKNIPPGVVDINMMLYLPLDTNGSFNATNIYGYVFSGYATIGPPNRRTGIDNITLTARTQRNKKAAGTVLVNVSQCLPHRNPDVAAYPYNDNEEWWMGNHTCCKDDFTYKSAASSCYTNVTYGGLLSFTNYSKKGPLAPTPSQFIFKSYTVNGFAGFFDTLNQNDNDIYQHTFGRTCSGDRGNICSGNAAETIVRTNSGAIDLIGKQCQDTATTERCTGPPVQDDRFIESNAPISQCQRYSRGRTFEWYAVNVYDSTRYPGEGTGICNGAQCRTAQAPAGVPDLLGESHFTCGTTCNGGGNCNIPNYCICSWRANSCLASKCDPLSGCNLARNMLCNGVDASADSHEDKLGRMICYNNIEQRCNNNCWAVNVTDIDTGKPLCRAENDDDPTEIRIGCRAESRCEGKPAGLRDGVSPYIGCTNNCSYRDCFPKTFNEATGTCNP